MCWPGDTTLWTISGPKTFADLVDEGVTETQVLTALDDGTTAFRLMRRIGPVQQRISQLVRVNLESGKDKGRAPSSVTTTPTHVLHTNAGERVRAADLWEGDRLASVYQHRIVKRGQERGYIRLENGVESVPEIYVQAGRPHGFRKSEPRYHIVTSVEDAGSSQVYTGAVDDTGRHYVQVRPGEGVLVDNCNEAERGAP